jgi:hypothetical protein
LNEVERVLEVSVSKNCVRESKVELQNMTGDFTGTGTSCEEGVDPRQDSAYSAEPNHNFVACLCGAFCLAFVGVEENVECYIGADIDS